MPYGYRNRRRRYGGYSMAQKLAYYKGKAAGTRRRRAVRRPRSVAPNVIASEPVVSGPIEGQGAYRRRRYRGRGGYIDDLVSDYQKSSASTSLGKIGSVAGDRIAKFFGWGQYHVSKNSLLLDPPPMINRSEGGQSTIRHREFLGDIITGDANTFKIQSFPINPAQEVTFPWLSQIASNYEQYRIEGMIFEFRSMAAEALNSTNLALGSVIMCTNYDVLDPPFKQKSEMENYEYGSSAKPSESQVHPIECDRSQTTITELYCRPDAVGMTAGQDLRFSDLGNFQIATNGFQAANVNVGELWVTYQVTFLKGKMFTALGDYNGYANYTHDNQCTVNNVFGLVGGVEDPDNYQINTIGIEISGATAGVITFPQSSLQRSYLIDLVWSYSAGITAGTVAIAATNCTLATGGLLTSPIGGPNSPQAGVVTLSQCHQRVMQTKGDGLVPSLSVTNTNPVSGVTNPQFHLVVVQIPNVASTLGD